VTTIHATASISGVIAPLQNVAISSQLAEPADSVLVNEGEHVRAGQVIRSSTRPTFARRQGADALRRRGDRRRTVAVRRIGPLTDRCRNAFRADGVLENAVSGGAAMEVKPSYLGTMIALATAAFGLIAALAWNKFITDLIGLFLKPGSGVWAELLYAVVITIIAVIVIQNLAKLAERDIGPRT
jgi:hypothetical protein